MKNKIKVIIADDEVASRDDLRYRLEKYSFVEIVAEVDTGIQVLENIVKTEIDAVFLDIEMPEMDGFSVAQSLLNKVHVIFVTAYPNYSLQAHDFHPLHYLLKPIDTDKLDQVILYLKKEILATAPYSEARISVKYSHSTTKIYVKDISCIIKKNRQTLLVKIDGDTIQSNESLSYYSDLLEAYSFKRMHNSVIANTNLDYSVRSCGDGTFKLAVQGFIDLLPINATIAKHIDDL